ncbi:hypothetical protein [Maricaulis sp.]|uniref:hypothetical protein n=1 Tax=Maricaulis sp. TaxID=1486257 RepID=UPI003A92EA12
MGGYGSGGRNRTGRPLYGQTSPLAVNRVAKAGGLESGARLTWQWTWTNGQESTIGIIGHGRCEGVTLAYQYYPSSGCEPVPVRIMVRVEWMPCHFGGERVWWLCPNCQRRCLKLYGWGGRHACRACQHIGYATQQEKHRDRIQSRANRVRKKLGGEPGVESFPRKPKGMHWRTYERYCDELEAADRAFFREYAAMYGLL